MLLGETILARLALIYMITDGADLVSMIHGYGDHTIIMEDLVITILGDSTTGGGPIDGIDGDVLDGADLVSAMLPTDGEVSMTHIIMVDIMARTTIGMVGTDTATEEEIMP